MIRALYFVGVGVLTGLVIGVSIMQGHYSITVVIGCPLLAVTIVGALDFAKNTRDDALEEAARVAASMMSDRQSMAHGWRIAKAIRGMMRNV